MSEDFLLKKDENINMRQLIIERRITKQMVGKSCHNIQTDGHT